MFYIHHTFHLYNDQYLYSWNLFSSHSNIWNSNYIFLIFHNDKFYLINLFVKIKLIILWLNFQKTLMYSYHCAHTMLCYSITQCPYYFYTIYICPVYKVILHDLHMRYAVLVVFCYLKSWMPYFLHWPLFCSFLIIICIIIIAIIIIIIVIIHVILNLIMLNGLRHNPLNKIIFIHVLFS